MKADEFLQEGELFGGESPLLDECSCSMVLRAADEDEATYGTTAKRQKARKIVIQ